MNRLTKMTLGLLVIASITSCSSHSSQKEYIYDFADEYQVGTMNIQAETAYSLYICWFQGDIQLLPNEGEELCIYEETNQELKDAEQLHYLLKDKSIYIQYAESGLETYNQLKKDLIISFPKGYSFENLHFQTHSYQITGEELSAKNVKIEESTGNIDIDFSLSPSSIIGKTTTGNMTFHFPYESKMNVSFSTEKGTYINEFEIDESTSSNVYSFLTTSGNLAIYKKDKTEHMILEKNFSKEKDDSIDFFTSGWMTANSKFQENSLVLIEGENHSMGPGMVRTPTFELVDEIITIDLFLQITGFNNATNREKFVNSTFKFSVDFLLKNEEGYTVIDSQYYSHIINDKDAEQGYFEEWNPYTQDRTQATHLSFTSKEKFDTLRIQYLNKPSFEENGKKQGMNLEIFTIKLSY